MPAYELVNERNKSALSLIIIIVGILFIVGSSLLDGYLFESISIKYSLLFVGLLIVGYGLFGHYMKQEEYEYV
ncbi:MAG: hypothetical protein ACMXYC_03465 [Candidatus Woesearchaeota archaeon]